VFKKMVSPFFLNTSHQDIGGTMPVDWNEMQQELFPSKDYAALSKRWKDAFGYAFVCQAYKFSMSEIADYTQRLLGGDPRQRYDAYCQQLVETIDQLERAEVGGIIDLVGRVGTSQQFEALIDQVEIEPKEVMALLKYLVYWVIPTRKYLSGLVIKGSPVEGAVKTLGSLGIRTNLDMLQRGLTPADRKALADAIGLAAPVIDTLTHTADFSRMPWASKATISNIIGTGYGSIAQLANADPEQLVQDFFKYGASIGKNLKFGNEIESSYRIAKIIPLVLVE
jgi:hypothetical protein